MPTFEAILLGHKCDVDYNYEPEDRGSNFEPYHLESVTIESIAIEAKDGYGRVFIDPNELHASQLERLEKEAMEHYKDRA